MKASINFILLGVCSYIVSMVILGQFMDAEIALYFSPFIIFLVATVFLLFSGSQYFLIPEIVKDKLRNKRKALRYQVDHYPTQMITPDGTKIDVLLNEVSSGGFQILCKETAGQSLLQKAAQLEKNRQTKVELRANIPFKERMEQIKAYCKIAYIANNEYEFEEAPYVAGLQVTKLIGESNQILKSLILGRTPVAVV